MATNIPEPYREAVELIVRMDDAERHALLEALDSAPPASSMQRLEAHLAVESGVAQQKIRATVAVASSLFMSVEGTEESEKVGLAGGVAEAAAREGLGGLEEGDSAAISALSRFLLDLFEREEVLGIAGKVASLLYDHASVYLNSRVLTDVRPLFDDRAEPSSIRAGMIVHTLRFGLMAAGREEAGAMYIALDQSDLRALRDTLDRAIVKERMLTQQLADWNLPLVDSQE